jgi:SM-20-related protein
MTSDWPERYDLSMTSKGIAHRLGQDGLCVQPGFLSAAFLAELRRDFAAAAEGFRRAGIGKDSVPRDDVRRDEIYWLDRERPTRAQARLWKKVELLKVALNRELFLNVTNFEGHYAAYPEGGFYERHLDSFQDDDRRVVSIVVYLNENWRPEHGGELRVWKGVPISGRDAPRNRHPIDVEPIGGTLVCFLSREIEHQVLVSHAPRHSFAGWFREGAYFWAQRAQK